MLLRDGLRALDSVAAAVRRAQRAGRAEPNLVLAVKAGADAGILPAVLTAYRAEPAALPVEVVPSIDERLSMLRDCPLTLVLAWPQESRSTAVAAFVRAAVPALAERRPTPAH